MEFKTHKINKKVLLPPKEKKPLSLETKQKIILTGISFFSAIVLIIGIGYFIRNLNLTDIVKGVILKAGIELKQTNEHTNILLLGTGGEGHDGGDLTDTIIVASIDHKNSLVPMLSIPRDLQVKTEYGNIKINSLYYFLKKEFEKQKELDPEAKALEEYKKSMEKIIGMPIHYYVKADFSGFKDMVDALDGVDVYVDKTIYDPYYPKDGTIYYETFKIAEGMQHMDGKIALKFARSRETTSDFDRAKRQQKLLFAIKDKALSLNILSDPEKIKNLYFSVKNNVETDLSIREMLEFGKIAENFSSEKIISHILTDNPLDKGGFLFVPESYYLLPYPKQNPSYKNIHLFVEMNLLNPLISNENKTIRILNGTKTTGLAAQTYYILRRFGFNAVETSNAETKDIEFTKIYLKNPDDFESMTIRYLLNKFVPGKIENNIPVEFLEFEEDIIIELGADYLENRNKELII